MIKFVVWILANDKAVSEKWYRLFSREHFEVKLLPDLAAIEQHSQGAWGIVFAEISPEALATTKDLKATLSGRKNISFIVFSKPDKTTNALISEFLESGADDYIVKPFNIRELTARINNQLEMKRLRDEAFSFPTGC